MKFFKTCFALGLTALTSTLLAQTPNSPFREEVQEKVAAPGAQDMVQKRINLRSVAEQGLQSMLAQLLQGIHAGPLPPDFPLNVSNSECLKEARLGLGYPLHTVDPIKVLEYDSLETAVRPIDHWHFLVMVKENPVGILEVSKVNDCWEAVSLGSAALSQDVFAMTNRHASRGNFRFVRVFQATSDLLEVQREDVSSVRYVPLVAARQSLRLNKTLQDEPVLTGREATLRLREAIVMNLAASQQ